MERKFLPMSQLPPLEGLPDALNGASTRNSGAPAGKRSRKSSAIICWAIFRERHSPSPAKCSPPGRSMAASASGKKFAWTSAGAKASNSIWCAPPREGRFPAIVWTYFVGRSDCPIGEELVDRGYVLAAFENNCPVQGP